MGDAYIQGEWSKTEMREGINWKDLRFLERSFGCWGPRMDKLGSGKSALQRMGNTTALSYANYGAGRVPQLAMLARGIKELEVSLRCAAAALRVAGRANSVADALPRFSVRA